ncbi:RNA polymerase sigma factor [Actinophytocola oryzae]|uniref:RNA polymerase sigma-70 factor (ECF subfamily) n=1 Tax=Actinophytocola oryzae TaxID=502181 RepID=A0A4R7URT0_9PSEU|nr:RNA polymerase sigma factor [Actinophytocola oryzae]TDV37589.1 RNA polymerase sigma-70 factor (ECF subfamily) [Actinophytocola oryzae]
MAVKDALDEAFRTEWGRVVATLIRVTGDWDLAEECASDAFASALATWPRDGVPRRPGAWLTTTARNRAIDRVRRGAAETDRLRRLAPVVPTHDDPGPAQPDDVPDDRLRLMFTCCHPALPLEAQVALTLRTLTGLTTPEIARAFLVPEATMAQRLVRAKRKIRNARIPYRVPPAELLAERTSGVLGVLYLLFNKDYSDPTADLTAEAIRLARVLVELMPGEPEAGGLLALMLFHEARRATRVDADGDLVTLADQDRARWDQAMIDEAVAVLDRAFDLARPGVYQLQAAIAGCHATAKDAADTDWRRIADLYTVVARVSPSPVVELNRAVAIAEVDGPAAALALVDTLRLDDYYLLPATRADLLRRMNRVPEAVAAYEKALAMAPTEAERRFLTRRVDDLRG